MTERPKYVPRITLGNILHLGIVLAGGTAAFVMLEAQAGVNQSNIATLREEVAGYEVRLRVVENEQARTDERFVSIIQALSRIKANIAQLEKQQ